MTKKLAALFDLPDDSVAELPTLPENTEVITAEALSNLEKIEASLPQVRGLEATDQQLDELRSLALNSYRDLTDLGMQVDSRYSAEILAVGASMMGHAITATTAKINKKLKTIELQLKKATLDNKQKDSTEVTNTPIGEAQLLDRNELLKMFRPNGAKT